MKLTNPSSAAVVLGLCAGLCALAAAGAGAGGGTKAGPPEAPGAGLWKAVAATGRVEWRAATTGQEAWEAVKRGDHLEPETFVRTHKRSRTTLTRSGDVILVDPRTEIVLPDRGPEPAQVIRQGAGHVLYRIEPASQRRLRIETPWLVAGVKGTVFSVIIEQDYASVSVASGLVEVLCRATGEIVELQPGEMAVVDTELGAMEVYRERREGKEGAGLPEREISRSASESLDATIDLLEEASASLDRSTMDGLAFDEMLHVDLSVWKIERDLRDRDLASSLDDGTGLLSGSEDTGLLTDTTNKLSTKRP